MAYLGAVYRRHVLRVRAVRVIIIVMVTVMVMVRVKVSGYLRVRAVGRHELGQQSVGAEGGEPVRVRVRARARVRAAVGWCRGRRTC